jgi:hypothetical protein
MRSWSQRIYLNEENPQSKIPSTYTGGGDFGSAITYASIVRLGPVNHFMAERCHQIHKMMRAPPVISGA